MGCGYHGDRWQRKMERMQSKMDRVRDVMARYGCADGNYSSYSYSGPSSGNRAFDEYRSETLRRLEDEQKEFHDFLDRLRMAKDKAEFDQFMAERSNRSTPDARPQS